MKKKLPSFIILGTSLLCLASCNINKPLKSSNIIENSTTTKSTKANIQTTALPSTSLDKSTNNTSNTESTSTPTSNPSSTTSISSSTTSIPASTPTNTPASSTTSTINPSSSLSTPTSKPSNTTSIPSSTTSIPTSTPTSTPASNTTSTTPSYVTTKYSLDLTKITTKLDKATLSAETLNNSFLTIINSDYVTARYDTNKNGNYCIENKDANLKITFKGTGSITISYSSNGSNNKSRIRLVDSNGNYINASSYIDYTYISEESAYEITGTTKKEITFNITSSGDYFIDCVSKTTNRGGRIYSINMSDTYITSNPTSTTTKPSSSTTSTTSTPSSSSSASSSKTTSSPSIDIPDQEKTEIEIIEEGNYGNSCYGIFSPIINHETTSDYTISYKKSNSNEYISLDKELLRKENNSFRYDIVGLTMGDYTIRIEAKNTVYKEYTTTISEYDKSGYAHFNYNSGIGAYNDDGTLKDNAYVLYVTEENKNTISLTINKKTYTGIVNILVNAKSINTPIDVRFIGRISAATWNELNNTTYSEATSSTIKGANGKYLSLSGYTQEEIISNGFNTLNETKYSKLNNLTNKILYDSSKKEFDSYYNMCDISEASNITLEGIGSNSEIFQWGFEFRKCNSIEVRNLIFTDYTEDAVGFEGSKSNVKTSGNYWVHNCEFNVGKNYWDVCSEQDKHDGDGSTDIKYCHDITVSYCIYNDTHKTNLIGANKDSLQYNITLHHNYYNEASQRLPLVRQTNLHSYNNYFLGNSNTLSGISIRSNSYSFVENCYFENMKNPIELRDDDSNESYKGYAVKAIGNYFTNCTVFSKTSNDKIQKGIKENNTTNRTETFTNSCKADGSTDMSSFDINTSLFYYDSINNKSKVNNMLEGTKVKDFVLKYSGLCGGQIINYYNN